MSRFTTGDQVLLYDERDNYLCRGRVIIRSSGWGPRHIPPSYGVLPKGKLSLADAILDIAEHRIRPCGMRLVSGAAEGCHAG